MSETKKEKEEAQIVSIGGIKCKNNVVVDFVTENELTAQEAFEEEACIYAGSETCEQCSWRVKKMSEKEEYIDFEEWRKDNSSYHVGAYLFEKFEEEIKEVSENAKNGDIVVYCPQQNRVYTIPPNADSVSPELIPLKEIKEEE